MSKKLTPKQQKLLDFIIEYQTKNNKIPSLQEMADHLGNITVAAISHKLNALTRKKLIYRETMYKILATESGALPVSKVDIGNSSAESGPLNNN